MSLVGRRGGTGAMKRKKYKTQNVIKGLDLTCQKPDARFGGYRPTPLADLDFAVSGLGKTLAKVHQNPPRFGLLQCARCSAAQGWN